MADLVRGAGGLADNIDAQIIPNPDVALESFQAGAGDLFLGGLPQRLALRQGDYREVVTLSKDFPQLYSFQSLLCSERMLAEKRPLLHAIDALWYDTCRRLYSDQDFRRLVFQEICDMLDRHGIEKHNLIKTTSRHCSARPVWTSRCSRRLPRSCGKRKASSGSPAKRFDPIYPVSGIHDRAGALSRPCLQSVLAQHGSFDRQAKSRCRRLHVDFSVPLCLLCLTASRGAAHQILRLGEEPLEIGSKLWREARGIYHKTA